MDALAATDPDLERLSRPPMRDDAHVGDRPRPPLDRLDAWLYSPARRVAEAVLVTDWTATPGASPRAAWHELLATHLHAGPGWTPVNAVAMPVHPPFDEPGLRLRPLLVVPGAVASAPGQYLSETMVGTVRFGASHVVPVRVFSAALWAELRMPHSS